MFFMHKEPFINVSDGPERGKKVLQKSDRPGKSGSFYAVREADEWFMRRLAS